MVARTVAVVLVPPWLGALPTFVPGRLRHGGFGALDDLVELPAIEPHPAALRAEVDFDALPLGDRQRDLARSEEHTSELQSLMRISYAVFCLKKKKKKENIELTSHHEHKYKTKASDHNHIRT